MKSRIFFRQSGYVIRTRRGHALERAWVAAAIVLIVLLQAYMGQRDETAALQLELAALQASYVRMATAPQTGCTGLSLVRDGAEPELRP